jgi:hypothetical protein
MDNKLYNKLYKKLYNKYKQKYLLLSKNYNEIIMIKNNITLTQDNINKFYNKSMADKKIFIKYAKKYNHEDMITLLSN